MRSTASSQALVDNTRFSDVNKLHQSSSICALGNDIRCVLSESDSGLTTADALQTALKIPKSNADMSTLRSKYLLNELCKKEVCLYTIYTIYYILYTIHFTLYTIYYRE